MASGRDRAALSDVAAERSDRLHLLRWKVRVAVLVAGVLDLDADGGRIDVGLARPVRRAGVPRAQAFRAPSA